MYDSSPDDEDRLNMCQFINDIRKELNLEEYPSDFLVRKSSDEIRRLYGRHVALRDNFESEKGAASLRENMKLLALPGVFLVIMVCIIISVNVSLNPQQQSPEDYAAAFQNEAAAEDLAGVAENEIFNYEISSENVTTEGNESSGIENLTEEEESFEITSFFSYEGSHSFIIQNMGTVNLTFSSFSVDGSAVSFGTFGGNYPIPSDESAYINISKACDGSEHILEVFTESGNENEFLMPSC